MRKSVLGSMIIVVDLSVLDGRLPTSASNIRGRRARCLIPMTAKIAPGRPRERRWCACVGGESRCSIPIDRFTIEDRLSHDRTRHPLSFFLPLGPIGVGKHKRTIVLPLDGHDVSIVIVEVVADDFLFRGLQLHERI